MEQGINGKSLWDVASKAGLALGAVSCAFMLINPLLAIKSGSVALNLLGSFLGLILWAAKFFGCIWLMKFFMKKLCKDFPDADNMHTRRLGIMAAALSALVYSAFSLAYVSYINPDMFNESFEMILESYSNIMSADELSQIEEIRGDMGRISFFTNFFYCFIYGCILSAIVSRNIPSQNPFEDTTDF